MRKVTPSKVAKANAHEKEPQMPVLGKGKRTQFTDKTAQAAVRSMKARAKR